VRKLATASLLAALFACQDAQPKLKAREEACTKDRDCLYGLECVAATSAPAAGDGGIAGADGGSADGGAMAARAGRTCQFKSFGDCEGDGMEPGSDGQPQCLNSYKCRDGHCTVQCAGHKDCKEGEVCKVGLCHKGGNATAQCYDNRDCPYPQTCYYGQCVTRTQSMRCMTDLDCGVGYRCINSVCQ
jgi:hypothetical protein